MINSFKQPTVLGRAAVVSWQWFTFLLPLLLVVGGALAVFRKAVVDSILSTPHPELVYAIFGVFLGGVLLTTAAMFQCTQEGNLIVRWMRSPLLERMQKFRRQVGRSELHPLYAALASDQWSDLGTRQKILEQELAAIGEHLDDKLTLPNFLAGALVGLGLVGTFVGLLATLDDLSKIFGALSNTGSDTANPAELFTDMVRRLQDPMRGMGTAFVASLYGLLGSLVLGLQILLAGKVTHSLKGLMQTMVRQSNHDLRDLASTSDLDAKVDVPPFLQGVNKTNLTASPPQLMFDLIRATQSLQTEQTHHWNGLTRQLREQHENNMRMLQEEQQSLRKQLLGSQQETAALRHSVNGLAEAAHKLMLTVRHSAAAEERYRASVPKTTYWQDAWVKVQAYLQRSLTDQNLAKLTQSSSAQTQALIDMSSTLASIDQRLHALLPTSGRDTKA